MKIDLNGSGIKEELELLKETRKTTEEIRHFKSSDFNDEFLNKLMELPKRKMYGQACLDTCTYKKDESFEFKDCAQNGYGTYKYIGITDEEITFPCIKVNNEIYSVLTPLNINMANEALRWFDGKVVILGTGLGYAVNLIANKFIVDEVVVVEENEDVAELFKNDILPLISHKQKIKIVTSNHLDYLRQAYDAHKNYKCGKIKKVDEQFNIDYVFCNKIQQTTQYMLFCQIFSTLHIQKSLFIDEGYHQEVIRNVLTDMIFEAAGEKEVEDSQQNSEITKIRIRLFNDCRCYNTKNYIKSKDMIERTICSSSDLKCLFNVDYLKCGYGNIHSYEVPFSF